MIERTETYNSLLDTAISNEEITSRRKSHTNDDIFSGCSWDKAIEYMRYGWEEGTTNLSTFPVPNSSSMQYVSDYDVSGDSIDVARYLEGIPECFTSHTVQPVRVVRIGVGCAFPASMRSEALVCVGQVACSLADSIEKSGDRAEIVGVINIKDTYKSNGPLNVSILLKSPNAPLDIERLAFATGHSAFLRRIIFAYMEIQAHLLSDMLHSNYGYPQELQPSDKFDIVIGGTVGDPNTWVQNAMKQLGYKKGE